MKKPILKLLALLASTWLSTAAISAEDRLLVVGDATWGGWSLDKTSVMIRSTDNPDVFTYTGYLTADKEFKFLTEAHWDRPEYRNASSDPYIYGDGKLQRGGDDNKFKVRESANYTVVCNTADLTISVVKASYQESPVLHNILYLVGNATPGGWALSKSTPLHQDAADPFIFSGKAVLSSAGTFKIATNCHADYGEQKFYFRSERGAGFISEDATDDRQWHVDADGVYLVTVDLRAESITMTPTTPDETREKRLCWYEPADAAQDEAVTLYFNAAAGNGALKGYTGKVLVTSGIVTADNDDLSGLVHMIGPDATTLPELYTMVRSSDNPDLYTLSLTPQKYYAVTSETRIKMLGLTFASADGSLKAADSDGGIIYVPLRKNTGTMWYRPEKATVNDPVTVYFDATSGNKGLEGYENDIYLHCGVLTDESTGPSDWKHSSGWCDNDNRYRMRRSTVNPDIYTLTFTPATFFGLDAAENVKSLVFVPRNADGSVKGGTDAGGDIVVDFINGSQEGDRVALGRYKSVDCTGNTATITAENGVLQLTAYNDCVIKVFTRINGDDSVERRSIAVSAVPEGSFTVEENDDCIKLSTRSTTVTVSKSDCHVEFSDISGKTVLKEKDGLDNSALPRTVSFDAMGDEAFYGGGYNGQRINLNGQTLVMNNTQTGGWESTWRAPHNICVPFIVSTGGYGLLFNDSYRNARITPSSEGTQYRSGSHAPISYFYVGGADGSMASVMENYTFLTGRQELPPYWTLGYMTSRYSYASQTEAEDVVKSVKDAGLPLDAIVFDLYWQGQNNSGMGNFKWYAPNYSNPVGMIDRFSKLGVKTVCISEPYFTSASANYAEAKRKGYFADDDVSGMEWLGSSPVGLIDATNPEAMDWMWSLYKPRTSEGIAGWWLDLGEPERHDADSRHAGGTVSEVHNEFGNLWVERIYRGLKEDFPSVRPFLMPRAGTAGMQRFATFPWTGDIKRSWAGLQAQIPALLSAGMSGIGYMGSDVGGFAASDTDPQLYLRWVEFATFSPMMRTHSPYKPEPYLDCYAEVLPAVRKFINLRYSYLPYTYTLAWENATKGTPLARPVNFHDTAGAGITTTDCSDEYLWGRDILVAPVTTASDSRSITFPQGKWLDLNDMTSVYTGGTTVNYKATAEILPHFGRVGSFIPRYSQTAYDHTGNIDFSRVTVTYLADFSADGTVSGTVYDDDRLSTGTLERKEFAITTFSGQTISGGHEITIEHSGSYQSMPASKTYTFVIPGYTAPVSGVNCGGTALPPAATKADFDAAEDKTYLLDSDMTLYIKTTAPTAGRTVIRILSSGAVTDLGENTRELTLDYSAPLGKFFYTLPAGSDAMISVCDIAGAEVANIQPLTADGTIHSADIHRIARGVYICTLSARTADGRHIARSVKAVMN